MSSFFDRAQFESNPPLRYMAYGILAMVLSVLHVVFLKYMEVSSVTPDLLLILIVWIALAEGQFIGLFAGFFCGILFDIVSADVLGSNALAKTIAGFVAGYFAKEGMAMEIVGSFRFLLIVAICGLIHNLIYFFFYIQPMQMGFGSFLVVYGAATTLYTMVIAIFPMLIVSRRKEF